MGACTNVQKIFKKMNNNFLLIFRKLINTRSYNFRFRVHTPSPSLPPNLISIGHRSLSEVYPFFVIAILFYVQRGFDARRSSRAVFIQDFSIERTVATARQRQRELKMWQLLMRQKFVYIEYLEMSSLYNFFLSTAVVLLRSVCLLGTLRSIRTITKMRRQP